MDSDVEINDICDECGNFGNLKNKLIPFAMVYRNICQECIDIWGID